MDPVQLKRNAKMTNKDPVSKAKDPASEAKDPAENASNNRGSERAAKKSDEIASHSDSRNATPDRGIPDNVKETKLNSIKSDLKNKYLLLFLSLH